MTACGIRACNQGSSKGGQVGRLITPICLAFRSLAPARGAWTEGEVEMSESRLGELEETAATLFATARNLPPEADRQKFIQEIGDFRFQISAFKGGGNLQPASRELKAN
jgi:hypothetical protein